MNISRKELENSAILVSISENIDHQDRYLLERFLNIALKETPKTLLIEMKNVTYICSADISVFVNLVNKAKSNNKSVFICNPSSIIKKTIEFTNTSSILPFMDKNKFETTMKH